MHPQLETEWVDIKSLLDEVSTGKRNRISYVLNEFSFCFFIPALLFQSVMYFIFTSLSFYDFK